MKNEKMYKKVALQDRQPSEIDNLIEDYETSRIAGENLYHAVEGLRYELLRSLEENALIGKITLENGLGKITLEINSQNELEDVVRDAQKIELIDVAEIMIRGSDRSEKLIKAIVWNWVHVRSDNVFTIKEVEKIVRDVADTVID